MGGTGMMDGGNKPMMAKLHYKFTDELFDCRIPKTEREHAAAAEIKVLRKQLEKSKCCGSCGWWTWYNQMQSCNCKGSEWYQKSVCPDNKCEEWAVWG